MCLGAWSVEAGHEGQGREAPPAGRLTERRHGPSAHLRLRCGNDEAMRNIRLENGPVRSSVKSRSRTSDLEFGYHDPLT